MCGIREWKLKRYAIEIGMYYKQQSNPEMFDKNSKTIAKEPGQGFGRTLTA